MTKEVLPEAGATSSQEIYCISYLRGLAALGVVLYHVRIDLWVGFNALRDNPFLGGPFDHGVAWLSLPAVFMSSGVMLFFVISGFCIHSPYAGLKSKELDLREYMVRRIFRIYPPFLVAVLFAFAVQWLGFHYGFLPSLDGPNYCLSVVLLQNSFGGQPECNPAFWTIPIEVAFYIFFPLVYLGLRRSFFSTLATGLLISLLAIASSLLAPIQASFLPYWFTWIAGAALAEKYKKGDLPRPPFWISLFGLLFFILGLFCSWRIRASMTVAAGGGHAGLIMLAGSLCYGIAFSVLLWWSLMNQSICQKLPSSLHGFLMYLGAVSYSLYLFHTPLFRLCGWLWTSHFGGKPVNYLITIPFIVLSLIVAGIAYRCIEAPAHIAGRQLATAIKSRPASGARTQAASDSS